MKHKIKLPNVTLVAMTSVNIPQTIKALQYSCIGVEFGSVKLVTDIVADIPTDSGIIVESCENIFDIGEWNRQIIYNLGDHIDTDFAMLIHDDGFVVNPTMWRDEFLDYDYIGSPWPYSPAHFTDCSGNVIRVGNSVSIRSKKLLDLPKKINMRHLPHFGEDVSICVHNRHLYLEHDIKFADIDVAKYFAHEMQIPEIEGIIPFAVHGRKGFFD